MARFYFHLRTAAGLEVTDEEGDDLPDHDAAERHAIGSAMDLMKGSKRDWRRTSFEVHDQQGRHVLTVWFREVAARPIAGHRSPPNDQHA
jgi:hypothetical protein